MDDEQRCQWAPPDVWNDEAQQYEPAPRESCPEPAAYVGCQPYSGAVTCEAHRCRCARPIQAQAAQAADDAATAARKALYRRVDSPRSRLGYVDLDRPGALFTVRQWDGMDGCWCDAPEATGVSAAEALEAWARYTSDGTRYVSFDEVDYFAIFPADTRMHWDGGPGREMLRGGAEPVEVESSPSPGLLEPSPGLRRLREFVEKLGEPTEDGVDADLAESLLRRSPFDHHVDGDGGADAPAIPLDRPGPIAPLPNETSITIHGCDRLDTHEERVRALRVVLGSLATLVYSIFEHDGIDGISYDEVQSIGRRPIRYRITVGRSEPLVRLAEPEVDR